MPVQIAQNQAFLNPTKVTKGEFQLSFAVGAEIFLESNDRSQVFFDFNVIQGSMYDMHYYSHSSRKRRRILHKTHLTQSGETFVSTTQKLYSSLTRASSNNTRRNM